MKDHDSAKQDEQNIQSQQAGRRFSGGEQEKLSHEQPNNPQSVVPESERLKQRERQRDNHVTEGPSVDQGARSGGKP
jgi:hypothetical protein